MLGVVNVRALSGAESSALMVSNGAAGAGDAGVEVQQGRVDLAPELQPEVVAEVIGRPPNQIPVRGGRVAERVAVPHHQAESGQGLQQGAQPADGDSGPVGEVDRSQRAVGEGGEDTDLQRREQRLGRHEAVRDRGDVTSSDCG